MFKKRPYRKIIYREKVNILLVQIVNRNLGDAVIADNAEYLIRQALPRFQARHYVLQRYDIQSEDYERVKAADLVVFGGGGLVKYKQEEFHAYVPALLSCAREHDIPVYFNSVGVEGYDGEDPRCLRLAQALSFSCVKGITVRDDLETLRRDYLEEGRGGDVFTAPTVDPAVYTPQAYGIRKEAQPDTVGLGIVRSRIFEDYGIPQVTREFQLEMWKGIVGELTARGYRWKLFVNGLRSDYDFAIEVLEYMGLASQASQFLAPRPITGSELAGTVASFAGVIACRMHANIIAYSLGVPSVGLVWNDKMVFWGERIGYPERFLSSGQFEPGLIVQRLADSIAQGVRPCPAALKDSVQKPLRKFIRKYGSKAWRGKRGIYVQKPFDWAGHLVATALGGIDMRYTNMNTPKGLEKALAGGFRIFEADIRLTRDGQLVCVNGWSKGTYEKLGMDMGGMKMGLDIDSKGMEPNTGGVKTGLQADGIKIGADAGGVKTGFNVGSKDMGLQADGMKTELNVGSKDIGLHADGMDYNTFMGCRMYGSFETMDARQLFERMQRMRQEDGGWKLILDIGKPDKETLADMIRKLHGLCSEQEDWKEHLVIRLQSKYDVEAVQEAGLPMQIMYYVPPKLKREEKGLALESVGKYCKKRGIRQVSMPKEALDEEVMEYLKKEKLKACVFSFNSYSEVLKAAQMGVDWIGTSYLSPRELLEWYEGKWTVVIR